MANEIERKWIFPISNTAVKYIEQQAQFKQDIQQGYLDMQQVCFDKDRLIIHGINVPINDKIKSELQLHNFRSAEVRYRIYDEKDAVMTVKSDGGLIRREDEFRVPLHVASFLTHYSLGKIHKTRFKSYESSTKLWQEFDIYDPGMHFNFGAIEIEFSSVAQAKGYVLKTDCIPVCEVTDNLAFKNKNLALNPEQAREELKQLFPYVCEKHKIRVMDGQNLKQM